MLAYPLLIVITLGLALPFVAQRSRRFITNHHKFGMSHFDMQARVQAFYMIYLKLLGTIVLITLLFGIAISLSIKNSGILNQPVLTPIRKPVIYQPQQASEFQVGLMKIADTMTAPDNVLNGQNTLPEDLSAQQPTTADTAQPSMQDVMKDVMKDLSPEEKVELERQMRAYEAQMKKPIEADTAPAKSEKPKNLFQKILDSYTVMLGSMAFLIVLGAILVYATMIFTVAAYLQSRVSNLVWNNTKLEHIAFLSTQRMRDLTWLYLSNIFVLIFTFGLATPWVQIRMARYRLSHLAITGEANWDQFVGEKKAQSKALGEEIADMFDVDLSFG